LPRPGHDRDCKALAKFDDDFGYFMANRISVDGTRERHVDFDDVGLEIWNRDIGSAGTANDLGSMNLDSIYPRSSAPAERTRIAPVIRLYRRCSGESGIGVAVPSNH
jgi:hypothetical protein